MICLNLFGLQITTAIGLFSRAEQSRRFCKPEIICNPTFAIDNNVGIFKFTNTLVLSYFDQGLRKRERERERLMAEEEQVEVESGNKLESRVEQPVFTSQDDDDHENRHHHNLFASSVSVQCDEDVEEKSQFLMVCVSLLFGKTDKTGWIFVFHSTLLH